MKTQPSWTTIAVATFRPIEDVAAATHVLGFAMLSATKLARDDWRFSLESEVAASLDDEPALLQQLADVMPHPQFVIGEGLEGEVFAPLVNAADRMVPPLNAWVSHRVARLRSALAVDLAPPVRRALLPFGERPQVRASLAVAVSGEAIVDRGGVFAELERRVATDWCRFLQLPGAARCGTAGIATMTWLAARGQAR
jgi:hypothetical protein